ncbi:Oidioi.mRNA.OKI2018_I69.XSR.g13905.t1.cds [Oikopleura dioica]|uniref:Oidioi.mRNA.OKI2018_I69.XSR.g13905.t1.cds n=1 Tax=Oikopleura dioica TaxID=34765 RepID=A0ABN7SFC1_OIKDI|nr:Oidioi.mRNA.OKI2018_I69.XSR.g13905.t1.cds [Oikopleura dioica]
MARCRIEYVLGDLVDNFSEDPPESRVARVRKEFLEYGLELPHLQASDVTSAKAFLRCLALWRGKSPRENSIDKAANNETASGPENAIATAVAIENSSENDEVAREEAGPSVQISDQPDDDFYVPGDDVPIDKILGFEKLQELPVTDEKASNDQEMSTIESELDVEVEMIESLAVEKWAEVDKKELRRVGSFSDMSKVDIRFSFPERDVDGELQIDEDALEDGELVSEDEKSTKSENAKEEVPKVEPYAPFYRKIEKNESRRCKTAFDERTTVEEDFYAEIREKRKNFREMQRLKHELQESRKKAEEERIRREMEAQNAEITDLTGSEPNSRDDSRPFCKVPPTKILFNKQRSSSSSSRSPITHIGKPITIQVPRQNVSPMRGLHRFVDQISKPAHNEPPSPVPKSFHPSPFHFNHRPEQHFAPPHVRPIKETQFKETPDQTNIRLNFDAFEILLKDPFRFHNIEFGDSRCHLFKKANDSDADLYPSAEFFTARFQGFDHKFCRLVINYLEDCTLPNSCYRRDCSIHVWKQYEIEHCIPYKRKSQIDYRISRSAGHNHPVKVGTTTEVTISASDVFNFNGYVAKHMPNTDTSDCVKTILGRPVPLIIIHALVSLRGAIKSASIEDWREIALELDIIQPWPTPFGGKTFAMQMIDGVKHFTREEYSNLLGHVVRELSQYYSHFQPLCKTITLNQTETTKKHPMQSGIGNEAQFAKRQRL